MRYALIGAAATMALLGATTLANAQMQDDKSKGPAAEGQDPAAAQPGKAQQQTGPSTRGMVTRTIALRGPRHDQPRTGADAGRDAPKAAQPQATDRPKGDGQRKAAQERATDSPKSSEAPKRDADKSTDRSKSTAAPEAGKDRQKATEQQPKDRKATEGPQHDMDRQKSTQGKDQQPRDATKSAQQPKQDERVRVSDQQRASVREHLTKTRVEKTRINVSVNIGTTIPRSVRLRPLPAAVFGIAPEYRGYNYVVLEDETIVIVHPRTYVVVDVIAVGSHRADRPHRTHLTLSPEQMRFVFTTVPKERTANIRARLALGAEVPRDVELLVFPGAVTTRIPELDRYRYVVAGGDVIIVDPSDHEVMLVIND